MHCLPGSVFVPTVVPAFAPIPHHAMEVDQASKFVTDLLQLMLARKGSDLFLTADFPPAIKQDGKVVKLSPQALTPAHTVQLARAVMSDRQAADFERTKECNFSISPAGLGRFRVNAFVQQGRVGLVLRVIPTQIHTVDGMGLPPILKDVVMSRRGLVVLAGGTGSGKTTLLNILSGYIPSGERVVTIEDAAELQLQQSHVVRLETRPPNIEGHGEITQRALVRNALRMRPDRIVIGEVRGGEALDMLQAMNTGHEGSMTTVHANTPRDALSRLENMMAMAGLQLPARIARQQMAAAISVVVQTLRLIDGRRKITSIQEITGMEADVISLQPIFGFRQVGVAPDGTVLGHFSASGVRPRVMERLQAYGLHLPDSMFDPSHLDSPL